MTSRVQREIYMQHVLPHRRITTRTGEAVRRTGKKRLSSSSRPSCPSTLGHQTKRTFVLRLGHDFNFIT